MSTQYGDLTGVIQIDCHENITSIYNLCKDNNFDLDNKFILGFGLGEFTTTGIGTKGKVGCDILYVLKDEYGGNFEEIKASISSKDNLSLKKETIFINYSDLGKYIKRFEFLSITRIAEDVMTIEIEENQ